jgi:hypothetical protein
MKPAGNTFGDGAHIYQRNFVGHVIGVVQAVAEASGLSAVIAHVSRGVKWRLKRNKVIWGAHPRGFSKEDKVQRKNINLTLSEGKAVGAGEDRVV